MNLADFTPPGALSLPESGRYTASTFPSEPRNWVSVVDTLPNPLLGRKFDLEAIAGPDMIFPPYTRLASHSTILKRKLVESRVLATYTNRYEHALPIFPSGS